MTSQNFDSRNLAPNFVQNLRPGLWLRGLIIAAAVILGLAACENSPSPKPKPDPQARALVREAESLQEGVRLGQRLSSLTLRDKDALTTLLSDIKLGLLRIAEDQTDIDALRLVKRSLQEWEKSAVQLQRVDEGVFQAFLVKVYALLSERSLALGLDVQDLSWVLFVTDFASGLQPFSSFSTSGQWEADWALDEPLVRISGFDQKAWLLSPTLDLSSIKDPAFRIDHLFMINRNTGAGATDVFDRKRIVTEAFKVLVSTDYESGNPNIATWNEVDISPLPSAYNFHAVKSPVISLEKYRSPKTTIAFLFDMKKDLGRHYVTWQINRFELLGAGSGLTWLERARSLWRHDFISKDIAPFQTVTFGPPGSQVWAPFAIGSGPPSMVKIEGKGTDSEAWLLSPQVLLKGEDLQLFTAETFLNVNVAKSRILISSDYAGGDPRKTEWQELKRPELPVINQGERKSLINGPIDLSAYKNKTVVVAFHFADGSATQGQVWDVRNLQIEGKSAEALKITEKNYNLSVGQAPTGPPVLQTYNFTSNSLAPFTSLSSPNSAAQWAPLAIRGVFKFAKVGSALEPIDAWLLSPKISYTGTRLLLSLKHTVNTPDWSLWKMKVSTDYQSGQPDLATWKDLNITPPTAVVPGRWTDLWVPDLDLSAFSGSPFVIGFHYQDPGGPGARVWEIESLVFSGDGKIQDSPLESAR